MSRTIGYQEFFKLQATTVNILHAPDKKKPPHPGRLFAVMRRFETNMETTTLHPVVMKLNFPFITRKPSFCGRTLIEGHNTELRHRYVLAMALELKANAADLADCEVQAIRLGGGSASIINGSDLDHLLRLIRSC